MLHFFCGSVYELDSFVLSSGQPTPASLDVCLGKLLFLRFLERRKLPSALVLATVMRLHESAAHDRRRIV